uniref:Venom S1 protease with CUB domain 1 n=1 Tax=Lethocerus distinctifemur TaxID=280095 RepID=A0A2K8JNK8_9HEMI|nr:venom S1 protease with CUB domain 1 [Lethocerus distinctifemur]
MGLVGVTILVILSLVGSGRADDVVLNLNDEGSETDIRSPSYPNPIPANSRSSWQINSPQGTKIKLYCTEANLPQDNPPGCDQFMLLIDAGETRRVVCGQQNGLSVEAEDNYMFIQLLTGAFEGGRVSCRATVTGHHSDNHRPDHLKSEKFDFVPSEETVHLDSSRNYYRFSSHNYPSQAPDRMKQVWRFTTLPNAKVKIFCTDFRLIQASNGECTDETVTFDDGVTSRAECGAKYGFKTESGTEKLTVTFRTGQYGRGAFTCQASTTAIPPFRDVESEEIDSSEHGGPAGEKSTTCNCGWANKAYGRIVNGVETFVNEFPFTVAIIDTQMRGQFCGGSIITRSFVLTAAHCTIKRILSGRHTSVVVGDHYLNYDGETNATKVIGVRAILQHEEFEPRTLKNDISLLLLDEPIEFNSLVGPVCLQSSPMDISGQYVKIIGWGLTQAGGSPSRSLQKVNVRTLHPASCHDVYRYVSADNPTQICTYGRMKGACHGDSGGPVVMHDPKTNRYVQVGLVSFGIICADENPTVHTYIYAYSGWIQDNIYAYSPEPTCTRID